MHRRRKQRKRRESRMASKPCMCRVRKARKGEKDLPGIYFLCIVVFVVAASCSGFRTKHRYEHFRAGATTASQQPLPRRRRSRALRPASWSCRWPPVRIAVRGTSEERVGRVVSAAHKTTLGERLCIFTKLGRGAASCFCVSRQSFIG